MKFSCLVVSLCLCTPILAEDSQHLFFENQPSAEKRRIALTIEGSEVTGTQTWQPGEGEHGSRGTLSGKIAKDGRIEATHHYTIEGSEQSEEEILKLTGETLYLGEGELVDAKNEGKLTLKDPSNVVFKTALKEIKTHEPTVRTPERKAIMEAMRGPIAKKIGAPVQFTGTIRVCGKWARFAGDVATTDGKAPRDETAAAELELDFFALLKLKNDQSWQVMHSGFAGDISVGEKAREKYPEAPWVLFE